jgi:5'-methylthioadenosine phosphorylase
MTTIILGGTAAYHLKLNAYAEVGERRIIETPFGISAPFIHLTAPEGHSVWFSSRHGEDGLQRSAAFVNHRATLWAARALGATGIFSWNGVGAIAPGLAVGQIVVPDDVLDMTRSRLASFSIAETHLSSGRPFAEDLRQRLIAASAALNLPHATHGIYVCTEGPRLETAAEIALFGWGGAAVVGMTLAPEIWLAAEIGIPYASLCIITNMATGRWHLDERRDFGPGIGVKGLQVTLKAAAPPPTP